MDEIIKAENIIDTEVGIVQDKIENEFYDTTTWGLLLIIIISCVIFDLGEMMFKIWSHKFLAYETFTYKIFFDWHSCFIFATQIQFGLCFIAVFIYGESSIFIYSAGILLAMPFACLNAYIFMGETINFQQIIAVTVLVVVTFWMITFETTGTDFPNHNPYQEIANGFEKYTPWCYLAFNIVIVYYSCALIIIRYYDLMDVNAELMQNSDKNDEVHKYFNHELPSDTRFSKSIALFFSCILIGSLSFWKALFGEAFTIYVKNYYVYDEKFEVAKFLLFLGLFVAIFVLKYYLKAYVFVNFEMNQVIPTQKPLIVIFVGTGKICFLEKEPIYPRSYFFSLFIVIIFSMVYAYYAVESPKKVPRKIIRTDIIDILQNQKYEMVPMTPLPNRNIPINMM